MRVHGSWFSPPTMRVLAMEVSSPDSVASAFPRQSHPANPAFSSVVPLLLGKKRSLEKHPQTDLTSDSKGKVQGAEVLV